MVHESRLPFAPTVLLRLKQPARTLLTLTIFAIAACDRPEQLAAPTAIEPSLLVDEATVAREVSTSATAGAAAASLIAIKSNPAMCLELSGSTVETKTRVATCNVNNPAQLFTVNQTTKEIISSSGRCLAALGKGSDALGDAIGLAICNKSARQLWTIVSSSGHLKGANGCITMRGNALKLGAEEFLGSCGWFPAWSQGFVISGGSGGTTPPPPPATATSISVTPPSVSIGVGATAQLAAVALDASGKPVSGATFTYSISTGGQAASVSATGLVTGKAAGKDTVRVVSGTLSKKVGVNVLAIAPPPPPPPTPPPSGLKATDPTLPLDSVRVLWPIRTGKTLAVHAGDNLQNIINQAQRGDEIVIDPNVTFTGNFVLPAKSGTAANGWILIRSANMAGLPPAGARATPRFAAAMPKLVTPNVSPALATAAGASGWYIAGIEMTTNAPSQYIHYGLVNLGRGDQQQNTLASVPSNIVLDRVYIHGISTVSLQRCVAMNSAYSAVVNSTLSQCAAKGFDSQAIAGWNGPGPYRIENNFLEGAGENIMFGGSDPFITNLIPSDITIRGNHFTKPLTWLGPFTVKNLFETKNARRLLVENNIFENCWIDGQTGFAVVLKSANAGGRAPWSQTSDLTFRYNIVRNASAGFSLAANPSAHPAVPAARIKIENNLIYQVGTFHGTTNGRMVQLLQGLLDVQFINNTFVHNAVAGQFLIMDTGPAKRLIVRDNISTWGGPWGAVMGTAPQGTQALGAFAPSSYTFDRNVVIGLPSNLLSGYPVSSYYASNMTNVGFVSPTTNDYRLNSSSPYAGKSTTNGNPGADAAGVVSRTSKVIVP